MAAPKLTPEQRNQMLQMLAEGEGHSVIAEALGCSTQNVDYYATKNGPAIDAAREQFKQAVINEGYAQKEYRVKKLAKLARRIEKRLEESLDATEVKISSTGQTISYQVFNRPEVAEYRATLDDIAKELGDRATRQEITGKDGEPFKVYLDIDIDKV